MCSGRPLQDSSDAPGGCPLRPSIRTSWDTWDTHQGRRHRPTSYFTRLAFSIPAARIRMDTEITTSNAPLNSAAEKRPNLLNRNDPINTPSAREIALMVRTIVPRRSCSLSGKYSYLELSCSALQVDIRIPKSRYQSTDV